jgi:ribonuclease J
MGQPRGADELVMVPLGGAGEIGMNAYLYGFGGWRRRKWIMVDLGVRFGGDHEPGIDLVLPDVAFAESERRNLLAIVLTHAHEDHIGALPWLWRRLGAPVYCTAFTAALVRNKLEEHGLAEDVPLRVVPTGGRFEAGPFALEYVAVSHSIPEPNALAIRTAAGTVLHSGDWKIDPTPSIPPVTDERRLREIGAEGVEALVCDSTNALRPGFSISEKAVGEELARVIAAAKHRVAVTTFASHVGRIDTIARAARACGREVVVAGRAMHRVIDAAREVGLLTQHTFQGDDAFGYLPRDKVVLICTGSQGEPRAAMSRIADGSHPELALEEGDTAVFSSRNIPGNEKAIGAVVNGLSALGVEVITADERPVHTSGHPREEELKALYSWLKPRLVVPMHGEMRHMRRQLAIARGAGVPEQMLVLDGQMVRLAPGPAELVDQIPAGILHVDGRLVVAPDGPARERRKMSFAGLAFVSVVIDDRGELTSAPELVLSGVPAETADGRWMREEVLDRIDQVIATMPRARRRDRAAVAEALKGAVRKTLETLWGKKPLCEVIVHRG